MHPSTLLLYAITDCDHLTGHALIAYTETLLQNGVTMLQFRDKNRTRTEARKDAQALAELCKRYRVPFIVNDDVELAREVDADGVHVGQDDASCRIARLKLGPDKLIGVSAHNIEEAKKAVADGADYLGCGAVFPSPSKKADTMSKETLRTITDAVDIPVVAIGGISPANVDELSDTGIDGISVISALYRSEDPIGVCHDLLAKARTLTGAAEPAKVSALIVNSDGTLCDTLAAWDKLYPDYLESQGIQPGPDLNKIVQNKTMPETAGYIKHNYSVYDGIVDIIKEWEWALNDFYRKEAKRQPGCDAFLEEIKARQLPLVIATEASKRLAEVLLEATNLTEYVSGIVSGVDDRYSRTEASFFERAAKETSADPAGIWAIEDNLAGIRSAQRAGYHAAAIRNRRHSDNDWQALKAEAEESFETLDELTEWLKLSK